MDRAIRRNLASGLNSSQCFLSLLSSSSTLIFDGYANPLLWCDRNWLADGKILRCQPHGIRKFFCPVEVWKGWSKCANVFIADEDDIRGDREIHALFEPRAL